MPRNHAADQWRDRDAACPSFSLLLCSSRHDALEGRSRRLQSLQVRFRRDFWFTATSGTHASQCRRGRRQRPPAARVEASLFLLLRVVVSATPTAAVGGLHTAAATGFTVSLSLAVSILIAALLLVAAVTLVVSHVTSSLLWVCHRTPRQAATPVPVTSAHEQEQGAALALNLQGDWRLRAIQRGRQIRDRLDRV